MINLNVILLVIFDVKIILIIIINVVIVEVMFD